MGTITGNIDGQTSRFFAFGNRADTPNPDHPRHRDYCPLPAPPNPHDRLA